MALEDVLRTNYHTIQIELVQDSNTNLKFYGPIVKGWFSNSLFNNKKLWNLIARNPHVDVRPYYIYPEHNGKSVFVNINLLGFSENFTKEIVFDLASNRDTHLGGLDCYVKAVRFKKERFPAIRKKNRYEVKFITPTSVFTRGEMEIPPTFNSICKGLVRSVNKFTKYYLKKAYPIRVNKLDIDPILYDFDLEFFDWEHINKKDKKITMKGVMGHVSYSDIGTTNEIKNILRLSGFFHVGKWNSYGFGKIEVT